MSRRALHTVALAALFIGVGKVLRVKVQKVAGKPRGKRWGKHWHHPHGPHFFKHRPFRHWGDSFERDAEGAEANGAEAII